MIEILGVAFILVCSVALVMILIRKIEKHYKNKYRPWLLMQVTKRICEGDNCEDYISWYAKNKLDGRVTPHFKRKEDCVSFARAMSGNSP